MLRINRGSIILQKLPRRPSDKFIIYVAQPILFRDINSQLDVIYPSPKNILSKIKQSIKLASQTNIKNINAYLEIDVISTGFSIKRKIRKPIYVAVLSGSIIYVEFSSPCMPEKLYENMPLTNLGLAHELGFGTIIPIPIY